MQVFGCVAHSWCPVNVGDLVSSSSSFPTAVRFSWTRSHPARTLPALSTPPSFLLSSTAHRPGLWARPYNLVQGLHRTPPNGEKRKEEERPFSGRPCPGPAPSLQRGGAWPATQPVPIWGENTAVLYCNRVSPKRLDPAAVHCCSSPTCAHAHTHVCEEMRG